jgi:hypothetical protein
MVYKRSSELFPYFWLPDLNFIEEFSSIKCSGFWVSTNKLCRGTRQRDNIYIINICILTYVYIYIIYINIYISYCYTRSFFRHYSAIAWYCEVLLISHFDFAISKFYYIDIAS